jgi:hypothetical protein
MAIRPRRLRASIAVGLALLTVALPATQAHAQTSPTNQGTGPVVLTFTPPSGDVSDCSQPFDVTGSGEVAVSLDGGAYAGPVSITGSFTCWLPNTPQDGSISLVISGSNQTGYLQCGTPSSPMEFWMSTVAFTLITVVGLCDVSGHTGGWKQFDVYGQWAYSAVDPSRGITAYSVAGESWFGDN